MPHLSPPPSSGGLVGRRAASGNTTITVSCLTRGGSLTLSAEAIIKSPSRHLDLINTTSSLHSKDGGAMSDKMGYYYTRDQIGSVHEMADGSGNLVSRMAYDSFGRVTVVSGTILPTKQFAGYYQHQTSGLALTLYRAYDPGTGRWLSRDPLENVERNEGPNLYDYVFDNPIMGIDPEGLKCCPQDVAEQKQKLIAAYNAAVAKLSKEGQLNDGLFDYFGRTSCKDSSWAVLREMQKMLNPWPPCWQCTWERGTKMPQGKENGDFRDHQWILCTGKQDTPPAPPVEIVFDWWWSETPGGDPGPNRKAYPNPAPMEP